MAVGTLPEKLQTKLDNLARRLHRLRLLRGGSLVVLTAVAGVAVALVLDAWLELPPVVRWMLAAAWIAAVTIVAWRSLIRPLRRPITAPGLAAAVEEEYPRLGERLTTAVDLDDGKDYHGSPAFVGMLIRETDQKTRTLDFGPAAPPNATEWLTAATVAAVLLLVAPVVFIPDYYLGLARRLLMPWDRRPAVVPFEIIAGPGDGFAARGRPLTITAELRPTREGTAIPDVVTLVLTAEDGKPLRLRMPRGDQSHNFAFRIDELKSNFRYYMQAGPIETANHAIIAVDPVELAGGPTTTLTPPAYATTLGVQTVDGLYDLKVLEHGRVVIDCQFDRPAESATLIMVPTAARPVPADKRANDVPPVKLPLTLSEDRRSGHVEFPARGGAKLRLELSAGHGIMTNTPEQTLTVTPDRPPEFRRVAGMPDHGSIRPTDALAFDLALADDLAVATVEIDYRVNGGPIQHEAVALPGLGTPIAAGRTEFKIAGKAKDGETLFLRLRATDNRNVPDAGLGPNVVAYPAGEHWIDLRVSADADSVRRQEVTSRRDDIDKRLRDLIARVDRADRRAYALHQEIEQDRTGAEAQTQTLRELTAEQAAMAKALTDLADDAAIAGLKPLADDIRAVGEREFRQAAEALRDAAAALDKARVPPLERADAALAEARGKLESLIQTNRDLADARLDQVQLDELAERERELAEQARQAATPEELDRLTKEQQEIADELKKLTENDVSLREAMKAAHADEARQLAEQARKLAEAERELDAKLAEAERQRNLAKLAELARRQKQLADEADRLASQTRAAAQAAKASPLDAQPAAKAADDLKAGDADAAQTRQNESARELDRLAGTLDRAAEATRDPREAARQLARLQEENRQRLERPAERAFARRQQEAIWNAVQSLDVPEGNAPARLDRQQAAELAAEAVRALMRNDASNAEFRMAQAKDWMDRLANDLPKTPQQRQTQQAGPPKADRPPPEGMATPGQVAKARELANRQRELRDQVRQATESDSASAREQSAANARQQELARQAGDLAKSLDRSAERMPKGGSQQSARGAAASARQGESALQKAQGGEAGQAKRARKQAADALEKAAGQAEQAARAGSNGRPQAGQQAGRQLQTAQGEMTAAQDRLGERQPQQAGGSMNRAADALRDAARQMGQRSEPQGAPREGAPDPAQAFAQGKGTPTAVDLPKELQKYAGKKWGELPGELRTRIVQDMKAQYGDDYARIIKLYFEQIAENNGKK
jgi:hypothetical protein